MPVLNWKSVRRGPAGKAVVHWGQIETDQPGFGDHSEMVYVRNVLHVTHLYKLRVHVRVGHYATLLMSGHDLVRQDVDSCSLAKCGEDIRKVV